MSFAFQCPVCQTIHQVADHLVGRRVHCPECNAVVEVSSSGSAGFPLPKVPLSDEADRLRSEVERARRTVTFDPPPSGPGETVMLEAVDIAASGAKLHGRPNMPPLPPANPPLGQQVVEEPPDEPVVRKSRLGDTEMDMTPMVDVTFQLLIFFMITAAFALQKAKEIPKPADTEASTNVIQVEDESSDMVTVRIDEFNTFTVINPDGEEEEAPSVQDLYIKLRRAKTGGSSGQLPTKLRVEAHPDSLHEKVVAALDAGNETGFAELELAAASEDE